MIDGAYIEKVGIRLMGNASLRTALGGRGGQGGMPRFGQGMLPKGGENRQDGRIRPEGLRQPPEENFTPPEETAGRDVAVPQQGWTA
ncbi:MAG: hypothetical protein R6W69_09630 [Anaerolineales bacterium]